MINVNIRRRGNWPESLTLENARQGDIVRGDIVRSYDFPGQRSDAYVEGVVTTVEDDRVVLHVTREVRKGVDVQVNLNRLEVGSPLGVSMFNGAPCVFLIAKREVRR